MGIVLKDKRCSLHLYQIAFFMKKLNTPIILFIALLVVSCGGADNKADLQTTKDNETPVAKERAIDGNRAATPVNEIPLTGNETKTGPDEILTNIDKHIISSAVFEKPATNAEGIRNCLINIKNNLADASFQKATVEVSILLQDGKEYRTDYYTIINLEPGGTKTIKIPNTSRGTSVVVHIIKVKSIELTHGEYILTGDHYVPKPE